MLGQVAGEHEDARVEEGHDGHQHLADALPRLTRQPYGIGLPGGEMGAHVGAGGGGDTRRGQLPGDGPAAGHGGEAAVGPAHAQRVGAVVQPDVADVARAAVDAPVGLTADDDSGTDTGGDLDEDERRAVRVVVALLGVRHEVGVVVDEDRDGCRRRIHLPGVRLLHP